MRAAVLKEYGEPLEIEDKDRPEPDEDEIVVETEACGICRSDWHVWQGDWEWMLGAKVPPGQILGHEPVGKVVEVGNKVDTVHQGDRVAVPFNLCDGTCGECRNGHSNICESLLPLGFVPMYQGAFAEEFKVRAADYNTVQVPDGVEPENIAGLGCRFSTAFHGLGHQADIEPGDWVAIHGCGGVGLSAVHIANALGGNVIAVDIMDEKLEKAEELGAVETVNAQEVDDVAGEVREI
ncbi:MAG: alcohol dehydrogenase catalytic domain-containing protein, partial [Halobacteria archaeon]|nr:alcohol dehydrogenase catalytic domain-containing protein [Halobacteria archaeon]